MPNMLKVSIGIIVRRAILSISWNPDPFSRVKTEPVPGKPLETAIIVKTAKETHKFIVQVRELQ